MGRIIIKNVDTIEAMIKSIFFKDRKCILPVIKVLIPIVAPTIEAIIIRSPSIGKNKSIVNLSL